MHHRGVDRGTEFTSRLVGVTFCEGYPDSLVRLEEFMVRGESAPIRLVRDLGNEFDSNAVSVMCVAAGGMIGRLNRHRAGLIGPRLDAGEQWRGVVEAVLIDPSHTDNPGVIVRSWQVRVV